MVLISKLSKKQQNAIKKTRQKQDPKLIYKQKIALLDRMINDLEQQKKKLPFYKSKEKKQLDKRINAAKQQKEEIQRKLNETFEPSAISPCTFQIIKFVIAVLFLVLLIKIYSRLSVFSSINEFYTTRQDAKAFN